MAVQSTSKKWMFIGGGVIVAAALVVFFQNYPPPAKDAAGTIGAAQRYHEPQITSADVQVSQDALTTWIQSETFERIIKDPEARRIFTDAAFMSALDSARKAAANPDMDGMRSVFAQADVNSLRKVLETADVDALRQLGKNATNPEYARLAAKNDFDGLRKALANADVDSLRKVFEQADASSLRKVFADSSFDGMRQLAQGNAALDAALKNGAFMQAMSDGALRDGLRSYARSLDTQNDPK